MITPGLLAYALLANQPVLTQSDPEYVLQVTSNSRPVADGVFRPKLSDNGRYVLLTSATADLDPADTNLLTDIYRLDRMAGSYQRVSASAGVEGNRSAARADISSDGQVVVFHSSATNLLQDDDNAVTDVFLWQSDRGPDQSLELVSLNMSGGPANGSSLNAALSRQGRYVAFSSMADNLVADDTNESSDIFVRDRMRGENVRVSIATNGQEGDRGSFQPSISDNGRYIAFTSESTNFSDNEFDQLPDLFVHDRSTGITMLVNQSSSNVRANADSANAVLSPDGSAVAFYSRATTLEPGRENIFFDIFVRDLLSLQTDLISAAGDAAANANSFNPALSARGQWVAFQSEARNLTPLDGNGQSDIYVVNRFSGQSFIASRRASGTSANAGSFAAGIVRDGSLVAFESAATNLLPSGSADTSGYLAVGDVGAVQRLALIPPATQNINADIDFVSVSADGRYAAVVTAADNLLPGDFNGLADAFVIDLQTRLVRLLSRSAGGGFLDAQEASITTAIDVSDDGCRTVMASEIDGALLGINPLLSDGNGVSDIFLRDECAVTALQVATLATQGLSTGSLPAAEPAVSADGEWIVFTSAAPELQDSAGPAGVTQVFRQPFSGGSERQQLSAVDGIGAEFSSTQPRLSADGSIVVFVSAEPQLDENLEPGQRPLAGQPQVYRFDANSGQTQLISAGVNGGIQVAPNGASFDPTVSADGQIVAFASAATNLTPQGTLPGQRLFVWRASDNLQDTEPNVATVLSAIAASAGNAATPRLSSDGKLLAFSSDDPNLVAGDQNGVKDVFAVDLANEQLVALGRQPDGALRAAGAQGVAAISQNDSDYQAVYVAPLSLVDTVLYQPLQRSEPVVVVDAHIESPLQSVERGAFRFQVRNTGAATIDASQALRVTLTPLEHPLVSVTDTPRWLCATGPPVSCLFVGDSEMGDQIPPGAAEMLTFEFDMFAGSEPLISSAAVSISTLTDPLTEVSALTTQRVDSGVVVALQSSETLLPGELGVSQVSVINGGQQPVTQLSIDLAPLVFGEPYHQFVLASDAPWLCSPVTDPELPPLTTRCDYTGAPIMPTDEVLLSSPLRLPPGVGRLLTRVGVASDAEVISPAPLQLMATEVQGLVFRSGFEG